MRFPTRLLVNNLVFAFLVWVAFCVVVALVAAVVALFGSLTQSAWEAAAQLPRWFALFVGVGLVREYLPMYIALGQTRRQFGTQAAVTAALYAPFLAALMTVGYLLESVLYGWADLSQRLGRVHLFTEPTQVPVVFLEHLIEFLAWLVAGGFMAAAFYRWQGGGILSVPLGVGLILLGGVALGTELSLPFIRRIAFSDPGSLTVTVGIGLGVFLLGLALTWAIIRDVPLRNTART
ncbi:hypothetical protein GCM10010517_60370 [Streptosporangium fragile]|uniref:Uncharacterized protein n=1 Tax=Streptosporangium fragile TaxID=46186 RepID=A0ABN3W7K8_9ACTN